MSPRALRAIAVTWISAMAVATVTAAMTAIWTGDSRWGGTAFLLLVVTFLSVLPAGYMYIEVAKDREVAAKLAYERSRMERELGLRP